MEEGEETVGIHEPLFKPLSDTTAQGQTSNSKSPDPKYENNTMIPKRLRARFLLEAKPCTPLEEIDPYYHDKQTFVAMGRWGTIHRYSYNSGNYVSLPPKNGLRKFAIFLETHWLFSAFIIATLLINVVALIKTQSFEIMASIDYGLWGDRIWFLNAMYIVNFVCLAVYCVEFVVKLIARGLIGDEFTAVRDPWIWLDAFVIFRGFFEGSSFLLNRKANFWVRIFKFVPLVPQIRKAFRTLLKAVRRLGAFLLLLCIFVWFFTILGLQLYMGTLTQKCIKDIPEDEDISDQSWVEHNQLRENWYSPGGHDAAICGNSSGSGICPENYTCLQGYGPNPDSGYTSFDNFMWSLLSVLRIGSEDFTEAIYSQMVAANGPWHLIYFWAIFFVLTFPMGCLFFSILGKLYSEENNPESEEEDRNLETVNGDLGVNDESEGIHNTLRSLLNRESTRYLLIFVILLDIFGISCYRHPEYYESSYLYFCNTFIPYISFTVYVAEFLAKLVALGPAKYFKDGWNLLDFIILCVFAPQIFQLTGSQISPIRFLKLGQYWPSLTLIFTVYRKTLKNLWGWILYTAIILGFFVVIGPFELGRLEVYNFQGRANFTADDIPRWTFIDFWHSFRMVVRMQIAEWIETLWDTMQYGGTYAFQFYLGANLCGGLLLSYLLVGIVHAAVGELESNDISRKGLKCIVAKLVAPLKVLTSKRKDSFDKLPTTEKEADVSEKQVEKEENGENATVKQEEQKTGNIKGGIRKNLQDLTDHIVYKVASVGIIVVASLAMIMEDSSGESKQMGLFIIEVLFTVAFLVFVIVDIVAHGIMESLFSRGTLFDYVLVVENILNLTIYQFSVTGPFRLGMFCLRSFRPLMLVSRMACLKAPFRVIVNQLKQIWEVILAVFFIWLMFDTFAVHRLSGLFYKCIEVETGNGNELRLNKSNCLAGNHTWEHSLFNFDDAGTGFVNMLFLSSRMGWIDIMNDAYDATSEDMARIKDHNKAWLLYFILFILTGGLGALGILFSHIFTKYRQNGGCDILLTLAQGKLYSERKENKKSGATWIVLEDEWIPAPENPACRNSIYKFVTNWYFDAVIMAVIIMDLIAMSVDHYQQREIYDTVLDYWNGGVLLLVYTPEMIIKIVAWGKYYFKSGWNIFDMIVVILGIAGILLSDLIEMYFVSPTLLRMLRILRIFRFPLGKKCGSDTIKIFMSAVGNAKSAIWNLLQLQLVVMWAFGLLGMYLFDNVLLKGGLNEQLNFRTFGNAFGTLALQYGFPGIDGLYEGLGNEDDCEIEDVETGSPRTCGDRSSAALYIGLYIGVTFMVLLNMYAALITEIMLEFERVKEPVQLEDEQVDNKEDLNNVVTDSGTEEPRESDGNDKLGDGVEDK